MGRRNLARGDVRNPGSPRKRFRAHERGRRKCCKLSKCEFVDVLPTPTALVAAVSSAASFCVQVVLRLNSFLCTDLLWCDLARPLGKALCQNTSPPHGRATV